MDFETASTYDICEAINRVVTLNVFRSALLSAMDKNFTRRAADPQARGDVGTQVVRPLSRGSDSNGWVHTQADAIVLDTMQAVVNHFSIREGSSGQVPAVFHGWNEVSNVDPSRRHAAVMLYVIQRQHDRRSFFLRVLYNVFLYFTVHRSRVNVGIDMCFPGVEGKPDPCNAKDNKYYAYAKKLVVGPTARITGSDEETAAPDGSTVQEVKGCLVRDSSLVLYWYTGRMGLSDGSVAVFADMVRGMVVDTTYDWSSTAPADRVGPDISGPGAWRLLLPRLSTREKIDSLKWTQGLC